MISGFGKELIEVTVSGGTGTNNSNSHNALWWYVVIKPPTEATTYTFEVVDNTTGYPTMKSRARSGTDNVLVKVPMVGIQKINITSASVDGDYEIWMVYDGS